MQLNVAGPAGRNGKVAYGQGGVAWGESKFSTWGGAGVTGGTNVVVLNISGAEYSKRESELFPAFAGVHMILAQMIHTGDTLIDGSRGYYFALEYANTSGTRMTDGWLRSQNSLPPPTNTTGCGDYTASIAPYCAGSPCTAGNVYGGGYGVSGCGGNSYLALGASVTEANAHSTETWQSLIPDHNDALGNGYYSSWVQCNYDCSYWTFDLP